MVIILIGVSLKKSIKMMVRATVGIPKKKIKTSSKSGIRKNQRTLLNPPQLKIDAITIL